MAQRAISGNAIRLFVIIQVFQLPEIAAQFPAYNDSGYFSLQAALAIKDKKGPSLWEGPGEAPEDHSGSESLVNRAFCFLLFLFFFLRSPVAFFLNVKTQVV